jgi:hypothetical protein
MYQATDQDLQATLIAERARHLRTAYELEFTTAALLSARDVARELAAARPTEQSRMEAAAKLRRHGVVVPRHMEPAA